MKLTHVLILTAAIAMFNSDAMNRRITLIPKNSRVGQELTRQGRLDEINAEILRRRGIFPAENKREMVAERVPAIAPIPKQEEANLLHGEEELDLELEEEEVAAEVINREIFLEEEENVEAVRKQENGGVADSLKNQDRKNNSEIQNEEKGPNQEKDDDGVLCPWPCLLL